MSEERGKRVYRSPLRDEQSEATRGRVIDAARDLIIRQGYAGTSMSAVARAADVSRETVYKAFGAKPQLLKAVYDQTLVGDQDETPVAERDWFRSILDDPDPRSALATFGRVSAGLVQRLGPLMAAVLAGANAGEADLQELAATSEAERLTGVRQIVEAIAERSRLRAGMTVERAVDEIWMLTAPEVWHLLVDRRGWSLADYGLWLGRACADVLLAPPTRLSSAESVASQ